MVTPVPSELLPDNLRPSQDIGGKKRRLDAGFNPVPVDMLPDSLRPAQTTPSKTKPTTSAPPTMTAAPSADADAETIKRGAPLPWDYVLDREGAIQRSRQYTKAFQTAVQRGLVEDVKTQTGFLDRVGDLFKSGLLNARSGLKDFEAAIEFHPELKKQFTEEARRYAADANIPIKDAVTEEAVKRDFLRNVIPYVLEKGVESLPQMGLAAATPIGGLLSGLTTTGQVARGRAEASGRQDVSGSDVAIAAPFGAVSTILDQFGLSEIIGTAGKNMAIRTLKAAVAEGGTESIQNLIEYLGSRLGTEKGVDAKEAFEQAMFGALAGAGMGGGLRGAKEVVTAPFGKKGPTTAVSEEEFKTRLEARFLDLAQQEVAKEMAADPSLTQRKAAELVRKRAKDILDTATQSVVAELSGGTTSGTAPTEPVPGGSQPSVPDTVGISGGEPAAASTEQPAPVGVGGTEPIAESTGAGEGAVQPALTPVPAPTTMKERKDAFRPVVDQAIDALAPDVKVPAKIKNMIVNVLAQNAAKGTPVGLIETTKGILAANNLLLETKVAEPPPATEPVVEEPAPTAEKPPPVPEPVVEEPAPTAEKPPPAPEPVVEEPAPEPVAEEPPPTAEEPPPPAEETAPAAEETAPAAEETAPAAEPVPPKIPPSALVKANSVAKRAGHDFETFRQGVEDARTGSLISDNLLAQFDPKEAAAYRAGANWAQEYIATEQAKQVAKEGDTSSEYQDVPEYSGVDTGLNEVRKVPALSRRLQRLYSLYRKGRISPEIFAVGTRSLVEDVQAARKEKRLQRLEADRVRGPDFVRQRLLEAKRRGILSEEAVDLAEWFIQQNPSLVDDLGISIREPTEAKIAGSYTPIDRVARLVAEGGNRTTVVHEIMHHLERMMPEAVQNSIRTSWAKALAAAAKKAKTLEERKYFNLVNNLHYGNLSDTEKSKALKSAREMVSDKLVPYDSYQYINPSEFWAVNATDIVTGKYDARGNVLRQLQNWLYEFANKIRNLFGLPSDAPIVRALDSLSKGDGVFQSKDMLYSQKGSVTFAAPQQTGSTPASGGSNPTSAANTAAVQNATVTLTPAQRKMLLQSAGLTQKANRIQKRIAATNNTAELVSKPIDLAKVARGDAENIAMLRGSLDALNVTKWKLILPTLTTEDIFRIIGDRIPGLKDADRMFRSDVMKFNTVEHNRLNEEVKKLSKFFQKFPKAVQALADVQFAAVAAQVDPSLATTPRQYADTVDQQTRDLKQELQTETDPKKRATISRKIGQRFSEIRSVYMGDTNLQVAGWHEFTDAKNGGVKAKEVWQMIRDAHRRDLNLTYAALRQRVIDTHNPQTVGDALTKLEKAFEAAREQKIYFPLMRYGDFYARVGSGANSLFRMFPSRSERDKFARVMQAKGETVTETGDIADLRSRYQNNKDTPISDVLDLFDGNQKSISALKDQVFDIWLQSVPGGEARKHMAPRKLRAGYSTDVLKNFATFRAASVNNLKRARYGYKLQNEIDRAKDSLAGSPEREKLGVFIREIEDKIMAEMYPPNTGLWGQFISLGNKAAYYQYLANVKTGVIQLTQMHIVSLPMLAEKHGNARAAAALSKYGFAGLAGFAASPATAVVEKGWVQPSLLSNPVVASKRQSNPELYDVLSEGWNEANDLNVFMDTFSHDIRSASSAKQRSILQEVLRGRPDVGTMRAGVAVFEALGGFMHQMERVNKEATFMASLELAYRDARKRNEPHAVAKANAIQSALDMTNAATFDFSRFNKPSAVTFRGQGVGRLTGQFMTYPLMMSSLLARKMYTAIKIDPNLSVKDRAKAATLATGVMFNTALYAGLTGVPLYGLAKVISYALAGIGGLFGDDEDKGLSYIDDEGNIKATYDVDWWFKNVWVPNFFGEGGTVANLFGLDDKTAGMLAASAVKGPISALTDIDLANSVALDFLFFLPKKQTRSEHLQGSIPETAFNIVGGAPAGVVMDYAGALDDLMGGYSDRALEKLPKVFANVAKATRFAREGQLSYQNELVGMDKDFWSSDKLIAQALGFNSTAADIRLDQTYSAKDIDRKITAERNKVLTKYRQAIGDVNKQGLNDKTQKEVDAAIEAAIKHNNKYPTHPVDNDTLFSVQENATEEFTKSKALKGVPYDYEGKTPYLLDMAARRAKEE